jgi:hypothetical protein
MGRFRDLTGERFGRLLVEGKGGYNKHHQLYWRCECECGKRKEVLGSLLRNSMTQSCGCLQKESISKVNFKHGMAKSNIWSIHRSMMDRCYSPNNKAYKHYGARGISVCDRWHDFESFFKDMGNKPDGMSLERVNNNGNYSPDNVIWADSKTQANNRTNSVMLTYNNRTQTMAQWCEEIDLKIATVWARLNKYGYSVEQALTPRRRAHNVS